MARRGEEAEYRREFQRSRSSFRVTETSIFTRTAEIPLPTVTRRAPETERIIARPR